MIKRLYGLKPIVDNKTKVLILGSFPGRESLEKKEYYAHKQNQFWPIISELFGDKRPLMSYSEKIDLLVKNKVGLWDVIASCYRKNSSDSEISGEELNDLKSFLKAHPRIRAVFFNGRKAENLFKQNHFSPAHIEYLPSTSPAYAKGYRFKATNWKRILEFA